MSKLTVLPINQSNQQHLLRPNTAFEIIGHCIALYDGEVVDVRSPQESSAIQYGVVTATNVETFLTNISGS